MKINADINSIDYNGVIEFIKDKIHASDSKIKSAALKIIETSPAKTALLKLMDFKPINRLIRHRTDDEILKKTSIAIKIKKLALKAEEENM